MPDFITVVAPGIQQASGAASVAVNIPACSSGELPRYIRVAATAAACVRLGATTATATAGDTQVQPGDSTILRVPSGYTKIAVIQVTAAGLVQVSPLEDM